MARSLKSQPNNVGGMDYNLTKNRGEQMDIFLAVNQTTGFMEMIFDNEDDCIQYVRKMTDKTGDEYDIQVEEAC